ncbi:hypothetical protein RDWZM_000204 [Blomia tropicalis]|uniref:ENTH domain-containing protein n=1 Tax=Blomia tropicalis TaxID=40697 RepID=A0A9Q0MA64_BLOTA|nr:hypothetical protein RDWZM_000204 [Blomia tropicalis]
MWKLRELYDKATNVVMNYTEVEAKVREATNDEQWGPTGTQMQELAQHTFTYEHFPEVMGMLWRRMLQDNAYNWRRSYKSLLVLSYLITNGSERVVTSAREHIYDLRRLENYTFVDEMGKDQGINVRHKAKSLIDMIQDDEKVRMERKKAKQFKDKFTGVSSDAMYANSFRDQWSEPRSENSYRDQDDEIIDDFDERPKKESFERKVVDSSESKVENVVTKRTETASNGNSKHTTSISNNNFVLTKPSKPRPEIKKVDLGAAALYAKQFEQQNQNSQPDAQPITSNNVDLFGVTEPIAPAGDLLSDLFDDMSINSNINGNENGLTALSTPQHTVNLADNFADFSQFQSAETVSNDDFADFQSAFDPSVSAPTLFNTNSTTNVNSFAAMNPFLSQQQEQLGSGPLMTPSIVPLVPQTLSPTSSVALTKPSSTKNATQTTSNASTPRIGETWSNININMNFDNILETKSNKPPAPSINQLASSAINTNQNVGDLRVSSPTLFASGTNNSFFDNQLNVKRNTNPQTNASASPWTNSNNSLL